MKDNLEAKFHKILLAAAKREFSQDISSVKFIVDSNIDNPSNSDAVDCQMFLKENSKTTKQAEKQSRS